MTQRTQTIQLNVKQKYENCVRIERSSVETLYKFLSLGNLVLASASQNGVVIDPLDLGLFSYMCGALCHSYLKSKSCDKCKDLLLLDENLGNPQFSLEGLSFDLNCFIDKICRGGLKRPSSLANDLFLKTWAIYEIIIRDQDMHSRLMASKKPQRILIEITLELLKSDCEFSGLISDSSTVLTCDNKHFFGKVIVRKLVNCLCKNYVAKRTDNDRDFRDDSRRKSQKFQGIC